MRPSGVLVKLLSCGRERRRRTPPQIAAPTPEDFGFGQLFREIRDAVVVGDAETGRIVLWNPAAADLFGIPVDEAVGLPIETLVPEALRERHRAGLARFREIGGGSLIDAGQPVELPALRRTGEPITIELTLSPIAVSTVPGRFVLAIIRDATLRKQVEADRLRLASEQATRVAALQAEESLRQSEERFRTAFDHAAIGMALVDRDGRFLRVNAALCTLTGYTEAELLARTFQDITHPDDVAADLARNSRLLAGETGAAQLEKRYLRKDGEVVWIRLNSVLVHDAHGAPLHFISQIEDITERKLAEQELHKRAARFRSLISNATDIITILDADGIIHYKSPPTERILGYHPDALVGRNAFGLIHPDDRAATWAVFASVLADPTSVPTVAFRFRHADGSWRWLESICTNLLDDRDVGGFVVNSRDITDRKRADAALRTALDGAQAANRAKGSFLDMMSHELRTPLQAVLGYSEFLLNAPRESLSIEQREDIGYIHQGGGRMIALINQLLDLSRMEAGRLELAADLVDLIEVIEAVRQDVAPQAAVKRLDLHIDLPPSLPRVIGDAERVRQILLNLVGNAVKFTTEGGVRITATVTSTGGVAVDVSDTGIGITEDMMPLIFEEFRQVDGNLARRHGGAGLGLAIARKLAEQMGGSISVSSEPNVGSTFRLHLPGASPGTASEPGGAPPNPNAFPSESR
jgi:PAS domain S-box-containing protein